MIQLVEYQTGAHQHGEFEVMRQSTAELFGHNATATWNSVSADVAAMMGVDVTLVAGDKRRQPRRAQFAVSISHAAAACPLRARDAIHEHISSRGIFCEHWEAFCCGQWITGSEI
jgi:hypothetical protein